MAMKTGGGCVWIGLLGLLAGACVGDRPLEEALRLAGDNRGELERVLEHYKDSGLKYEAARFLIENMPGAYSVDPRMVEMCKPFYEAYDELAKAYNYEVSTAWGERVDSLWKDFNFRHSVRPDKRIQDIHVMTADRLIKEIDFAFKVWQENAFTRDCSFDDFCEYILPYRRYNGLLVDDSRQRIYERNRGRYFVEKDSTCLSDADSLLLAYSYLTHSLFWGTHIPIYDGETFEKLRHGLCAQRCWYNSLLFSSLGMAVAIDFVPAWGNRNNSHSWNVLIENDTIYPFDAFWEKDRWKYSRLYNNKERDRWWGKFRLPKVYRYTYSNHLEGPLADADTEREDIPVLFRSFKMKDVSADYFETADVTVELTADAEGMKYAYLSVFNSGEWYPVQWGRIENGKATFKAMGRDIVYLPVYYEKGQVRPAGSPFLLTTSGLMERLEGGAETESVFVRMLTGHSYYNSKTMYAGCMNHTTIWGVKDGKEEKIASFPWWMPLERTRLGVKSDTPYRTIRLKLPSDSIAMGDIIFLTDRGPVKDVKVATALKASYPGEEPQMLVDGIGATAFRGKAPERYVDFDLGKEYSLSYITVGPFWCSALAREDYFELLHWKDGWRSLGMKQGTGNFLQFDDVPAGALLLLRKCDSNSRSVERIFRYREGEARWY